ncbi:MAG: PorP/SprF family type IX secretion system membrane protein [Cyclobacteriaceae bacterium]|nr:PorP/SprF family type IX secretion system membrane protein [Cyclobacteriaceae bacterium]
MRRILLAVCIFSSFAVTGQDIPLFSQKLTNSFMYNPALAGHTFGSITTSYRENYSGVANAPKNYFISVHTPIAGHRFGVGANVFQEEVSILKNTYIGGAFAYHLYFNKFSSLSSGVGIEYNMLDFNGLTSADLSYISNDPTYLRYENTGGKPDFSFGLMFQNRFVKVGLAANRLATAWLEPTNTKVLSNYYTGFVQGQIPIREGQDVLEPFFSFRKFSEDNYNYDVGLYYTYDNKITIGSAIRAGNLLNFTLGYRFNKYLMVGYSREMITSPVGGFVGSSSEFTLRYDFNDQNYQKKFRQDYKQSLSYRRKSISSSPVRKTAGGRTPKQLARAQKRVAAFSPNSRYQNTKKLSMGRKSSTKRPTYNKKRSSSKKKVYKPKKRRR